MTLFFQTFHAFSSPLCLPLYLGVLARNASNVRSQPQLTHVTKSDLQGANLTTECLDVLLEEVSPPDLCDGLGVVWDLVQLHLLRVAIDVQLHHVLLNLCNCRIALVVSASCGPAHSL